MTKGWKVGLGILAGALVIGAIVRPRPEQQANVESQATSARPAEKPSSKESEPAAEGVTMAGYQRLQTGMTYRQVVAILGEEGEELSSNEIAGTRTVMYKWSTRFGTGNMNVMFQDDKMIQKAQFGLQ